MSSSPNPTSPQDASASPFAGLGAGLGFFQDWMKAASSALPNLGATAPTGTAWAMPTLDPEELDKRIQELKTVQFWLEQNARMIGMTIQTLEVQRMTLQTLRGMKVPLDALRESLKVPPIEPLAPSAPPTADTPPSVEPPPASPSTAPEASSDTAAANPLSWWDTLATQFTTLATQAVQAGQEAMSTLQAGAAAPPPAADKSPARKRGRASADTAPASSATQTGARTQGPRPAPQPKAKRARAAHPLADSGSDATQAPAPARTPRSAPKR